VPVVAQAGNCVVSGLIASAISSTVGLLPAARVAGMCSGRSRDPGVGGGAFVLGVVGDFLGDQCANYTNQEFRSTTTTVSYMAAHARIGRARWPFAIIEQESAAKANSTSSGIVYDITSHIARAWAANPHRLCQISQRPSPAHSAETHVAWVPGGSATWRPYAQLDLRGSE
jgi:hypothetical protein